jgi:hypothetical protein
MIPCGIADVTMTSIERELLDRADGACLAPPPDLAQQAREAVIRAMARVFSLQPEAVTPRQLASIAKAPRSAA